MDTEGDGLNECSIETVELADTVGEIDNIEVYVIIKETLMVKDTEVLVVKDTEAEGELQGVTVAEDVRLGDTDVELLADEHGDEEPVFLVEIVVKTVLLDDDDWLTLCVKIEDFDGSREVEGDVLVVGETREEMLTEELPHEVDEGVVDLITDGVLTEDTDLNEVPETLVVGDSECDTIADLESDCETDGEELNVLISCEIVGKTVIDFNTVKLFKDVVDTDEQGVDERDRITDMEEVEETDRKEVTDGE